MKAITLWPEWIWAMCHLGKRVENRTWVPPKALLGQVIALHAGAHIGGRKGRPAMLDGMYAVCYMAHRAGWVCSHRETFYDGSEKYFFDGPGGHKSILVDEIPKKAIVATCRINIDQLTPEQEKWAAQGHRHWALSDFNVLPEPISIRGSQGFWDWDGSLS
jgi:hypothetical protein